MNRKWLIYILKFLEYNSFSCKVMEVIGANMNYEQKLSEGVEKGIISLEQKNKLVELFSNNTINTKVEQTSEKKFSVETFLYYFGSFIILCAMGYFMSNTITKSTFLAIFTLGSLYALIFAGLGEYLWKKADKLPASLLYFLFVTMITFLVMVVEKITGFFPHFSEMHQYSNFYLACRPALILLAFTSIIVGVVVLQNRKAPLLTIPIISGAYSLAYMIGPMFIGNIKEPTMVNAMWINFLFSLSLIITAFIKDKLTEIDYSKWSYIIGAILFYPSILVLVSYYFKHINVEIIQGLMGLIGLLYIVSSLLLQRKVFMILGVFGFVGYIFHLEFKYITHAPILLPSVILLTGLLIFYAGILYHQNREKVDEFVDGIIPKNIRHLFPKYRDV